MIAVLAFDLSNMAATRLVQLLSTSNVACSKEERNVPSYFTLMDSNSHVYSDRWLMASLMDSATLLDGMCKTLNRSNYISSFPVFHFVNAMMT